ncbi:MAG: peptidase family protein [Ilumatobacteraceae bacterium]|nr:peptidase family protein [Ilumatobacteraceae bacterium]
MAGQPAFHLFGFPIHVRPGFIVFMGLVIFAYGSDLGLWIAGSAAVLTLLHELGHAFAARATGANAEISLDFLAGFASFVPTRPLKRWERAGISLAGPAVQICVSLAVLTAMGVNPLQRSSFTDSAASLAIWWTGPVMGLFNLMPILPLDGGHIVQAGLDAIIPGRSKKAMLYFSLAVTGSLAVVVLVTPAWHNYAFFLLFPGMVQLQMLFADKPRPNSARANASNAEAQAWNTGDLSRIPEGLVPSPWFRAAQHMSQGHPDVARAIVVSDFADATPPNWWPPDAAPVARLEGIVDLLGTPLPTGRLYSEHVLSNMLLRLGRYQTAADYAAASFARHRSTTTAAVVARAASALGDTDTAIGWLRAAVDTDTDPDGLAITMDAAPELGSVRHDPRFTELRQRIEA